MVTHDDAIHGDTSLREKKGGTAPGSTEDEVELSIIMPCLNEARTVGTCVRKAKEFLDRRRICGEVIVADNGSDDGSPEIASAAGARIVNVSRRGYGAAIIGGVGAARGRHVIMADSDESYDLASLDGFIDALRRGSDLVMGCRLRTGGGTIRAGAMPWLHLHLGNPVLSFIGKILFNVRVTDFHCGLRGMPRKIFDRMDLRTAGMEFASEMVIKASLLHLKVDQIPIVLYPDGRGRPPHLRTWRDGWRHLRLLLLYSPAWLFLYPGLLLAGFGLLGMLSVGVFDRVHVGGVILYTNSLLAFSLAFLSGTQLVSFAFIARAFGIVSRLSPWPRGGSRAPELYLYGAALLGALALLAGGGIISAKVFVWMQHGFTMTWEEYRLGMRTMILAVTLTVFGLQSLFFSFVLSMTSLVRD